MPTHGNGGTVAWSLYINITLLLGLGGSPLLHMYSPPATSRRLSGRLARSGDDNEVAVAVFVGGWHCYLSLCIGTRLMYISLYAS